MKQAPWILCTLLFSVILYLVTCNKKVDTVPRSDYDAMVKAVTDTAHYYKEIIKADDAAIDLATIKAEESEQRARESEVKLTESQVVIARQKVKIEAAKKEKLDSSFIAVSPRFVEGCDSIALLSGAQDLLLNKYKKDNAELKAAKDKEVAVRDSALANRQRFNYALQKQLESCHAKVKEKEEEKVKNQWYGIIGLTGNKLNPLGGGEAGITLINKKGVLYGVKGELLAGQLWFGVKTGVRLFK
jgi:hypothetical protein